LASCWLIVDPPTSLAWRGVPGFVLGLALGTRFGALVACPRPFRWHPSPRRRGRRSRRPRWRSPRRFRFEMRCDWRRPSPGSSASACLSTSSRQASLRWKAGGLRVHYGHQRDARREHPLQAGAQRQQQRRHRATPGARPASRRRRVSGRPLSFGRRLSGQAPSRCAAPAAPVRSGRTPRHSEKASAACSTSMPRPSRAAAPWPRRPVQEGLGRRAVHQVHRQRARPSTRAGTGDGVPLQAAGAGIEHTVESRLPVGRSLAHSRHPGGRPARHDGSTSACARSDAAVGHHHWRGRPAASGPSTPAPAPPAPTSSTGAGQRRLPALCLDVAHEADAVGVVGHQPPASKRSTLAAPASRARSLHTAPAPAPRT
jgi:hypothetical protein